MNKLELHRVADDIDIRNLRGFMLAQPQYYPDYGDWVDGKCLPRIESRAAEGWIALADGRVAGSAVYLPATGGVEIKNFRIDPEYRNRSLGHFLLRQVEVEGAVFAGAEPGELAVVTDVSTMNFSGVEFFVRNGFHITGMDDLYMPGQAEYLLQKPAQAG